MSNGPDQPEPGMPGYLSKEQLDKFLKPYEEREKRKKQLIPLIQQRERELIRELGLSEIVITLDTTPSSRELFTKYFDPDNGVLAQRHKTYMQDPEYRELNKEYERLTNDYKRPVSLPEFDEEEKCGGVIIEPPWMTNIPLFTI